MWLGRPAFYPIDSYWLPYWCLCWPFSSHPLLCHVTCNKCEEFFSNILGGIWEHLSFSPKEHNVKKESEAKTEIFFFFFCHRKQVSQCQLVNIIGSLVALFTALPSVYLSLSLSLSFFFSYLPSCLLKAKDISENWNSLVFLTEGVYLDLNWWLANTQIIPAHSYLSFPVRKTIETDASTSGWEALVNGLEDKGIWDSELTKLNRNKLKLFTVE